MGRSLEALGMVGRPGTLISFRGERNGSVAPPLERREGEPFQSIRYGGMVAARRGFWVRQSVKREHSSYSSAGRGKSIGDEPKGNAPTRRHFGP